MQQPSRPSVLDLIHLDLEDKLNSITEYVYCLSSDGRFLYLNKACEKFLNISNKKVLGLPAKDFTPVELYKTASENNQYVLNQGNHISEICFNNQWFKFIKVLINFENHENAILTIIRDITEYKSEQLALLKDTYSVNAQLIDSQNLLAQLSINIESIIVPYSVILCELAHFKETNHTYGSKITTTHLELIKKLMYSCLAGREHWIYQVDECFVLIINNASEGEIFFLRDNIELAFQNNQLLTEQLHANFGIAHIKSKKDSFSDAINRANRQLYLNTHQGKINLALNDHIADISNRNMKAFKHDECTNLTSLKHLSDAERLLFLEKSFHASDNIFVLLSPDAHILAVNDAFCKLSGYSEKDVIGQPVSLCIPNFASQKAYYKRFHLAEENGYWEEEAYFKSKHDQIYFFFNRIECIYNSTGQLEYYVSISQDFTEIKNKQAEVQQIAYYDQVTNLPNEHCFTQMLSEKILTRASESSFAIVLIDIKNFHNINDIYGFKIGDTALKSVAIRLDLFFGKDSLLSRVNGDRFIATIDNASEVKLRQHLNELQKAFSKELPLNYSHNAPLKINTGISLFPRDGQTASILMDKANIALNSAKQNQYNYAIFDSKMMEISEKILSIKNLILAGLTHSDYFTLMYQPRIRIDTNEVSGYEVFIKLMSPQDKKEIISDIYVPIAEKVGLITQLNEWVVREVSIKGARLYAQEKLTEKISISLSPIQLEDPDFIDSLVDIFRFSELPINNISFDIKDSNVLFEQKTIINNLARLDKMGVDVCIELYSTKNSYFTTSCELAVKKIKIDKQFISQLDRNIKALAVTKCICTLAQTLQIDTLAVGVENINQEEILHEIGCIEAQGNFYSLPLMFDSL